MKRACRYAGLELLATAVVLLDRDLRVTLRQSGRGKSVRAVASASWSAIRRSRLFGDAPALFQAIDKALANGASYTEQELELGVGRQAAGCICHAPCRSSTRPARRLLLEFRHIDQQLKIAREERLLEQQQANRDLIRSLAHEIKNPLGGIRGAAQLLERELDRRRCIEYTQVIIGEADRLQSLVDRLLTPHRLPKYRRTNIHEILARVRQRRAGGVSADRDSCPISTSACPSSKPIPSSSRRRCSTSCATPRRRSRARTAIRRSA